MDKIAEAKQRLLGKVVKISHKGHEPADFEFDPENNEEGTKVRQRIDQLR